MLERWPEIQAVPRALTCGAPVSPGRDTYLGWEGSWLRLTGRAIEPPAESMPLFGEAARD